MLIGVLFCAFIVPIQHFVEWVFGVQVFNAKIYFLAQLPARLDPMEVVIVAVFSLLCAFLSTLYPAWARLAARSVEALRYE
ncbi:MAG: hypothetical protein WDM85_11200 [Caulobacteraceae bacterium]